jgi:poly-gamma-glutamate synthesis protein (capsule biosynthesis protein)
MAFADEDAVRRAVAAARRKADIVVASFHWGIEYRGMPTDWQVHLAHVAAQAGADLVLGHHPHVLQGVEVIPNKARRCWVFYSLASCVFDPLPGYPKNSAYVRLRLTRHGVTSAELVPIEMDRCRPRYASADEAAHTLREVTTLSQPWKTTISNGFVMPH